MASMACQKLTPLTRIYQDHHHPHHHHHMVPFGTPPQQDPLHTSLNDRNSFLGYSSNSIIATDLSSIRCIFEGVVRVDKQATAAAGTTATATATTTMEQALHKAATHRDLCDEPDSMENSDSSISSSFMSSNSDDEDEISSSSTSSFSQIFPPNDADSPQHEGPLDNLTSLCAALPIKRGLSRYFSGKSQSFSSLARVSSVMDLAKPENPYVKRRRTAAGGDSLLKHHSYPPRCAGISKRHANNRYKSVRSLPLHEDAALEGQAKPKPWPAKCFSLPELQNTEF